jgi:glycosyltransferase involved in cell wall biosynthesis
MTRISVLVTPRDPNPYQELLYEGVADAGVKVRYADGPTPSHTLNLVLAPLLLVWYRLRGFCILHIHWTFQFYLPWARGKPWARQVMQWWFRLYIFIADFIGYEIVWTAHDIFPYDQIFNDDGRAQDLLIASSRAIVALSSASADKLRSLGAKNVYVVPFGSYVEPYAVTMTKDEARASLGFDAGDVIVIFTGRVERYKGVDLLLIAIGRLPPTSRIKVMVVGPCTDDAYRVEVESLAEDIGGRALLNLQWVSDNELGHKLRASDFAAYPFRSITNSSSIILAESFGLPVVIPDVAMLRDVPSDTAIRYTPKDDVETDALLAALQEAEHLSDADYREMSAAASTWAHSNDWTSVAQLMTNVYKTVLGIPT